MPHHAWIIAKMDGTVEACHCTCMTGFGEVCSHAAGILFAIDFIVQKLDENSSCTSQLNGWLPPSEKDVKISELRDVSKN
jgi:hypothetical protein